MLPVTSLAFFFVKATILGRQVRTMVQAIHRWFTLLNAISQVSGAQAKPARTPELARCRLSR